MKYLRATLIGACAGFLLVALVGTVWGALTLAAPCQGGREDLPIMQRVIEGALFAGFAFVWLFGLPAALAGALIGLLFAPAILRWNARWAARYTDRSSNADT